MCKSHQSPASWPIVAMVGVVAGMPLMSAAEGRAEDDRAVRLGTVVEGPVNDVWAALTTEAGIESWMVPMADVDLRIGGKMRTNYNPHGTFGDTTTAEYEILSFEPQRMLSVKTIKPAEGFPFMEAFKSTWTVIYVEPLAPSRTRVDIASLGYTDDPESQRMREFFGRANTTALKRLQGRFAHATFVDPPSASGFRGMIMTDRTLRKQVEVPASVSTLWNAWTTPEGAAPFFAPQAKIELKIGGAFEMYFLSEEPYGGRGSEGCKILAYLPSQMLAFDWSAPPSIPELRASGAKTQVVIEFEPLGSDRTKVKLTQCGFREGEEWARYYAYFDNAWDVVLRRLKDNVSGTGGSPLKPDKTWVDGETSVSTFFAPAKRQDFAVDLPAPAEKVWHMLTTAEGVRSFYPTDPVIELRPGGRYDLHGGTPTRVLSFVPREILAVTGSAPEKFPTVREGGTWAVFRFDPLDEKRTRLRMSVVGWQRGEEWDQAFDYFLQANAAFFNMLHKSLTTKP